MSTLDRPSPRKKPSRSVSDLLERSPPHSLEAEKGVLGSLLLDPRMCDDVALVLRPDDFYSPHHKCLYGHVLEMHNKGRTVDMTLLLERLKTSGDLEIIGGENYLAELAESVPLAGNSVWYARIVAEKSLLRNLIQASTEILQDSYDQGSEPRELLAQAEQKVFAILEDRTGTGDVNTLHDILMDVNLRIEDRFNSGGGISGVATHLTDVDVKTGGLQNSELVILAARPSMGKTALATTIAENVALKGKQTVLFVSLEMSRLELGERMLCSHGRINSYNVRNGTLSASDRRKLVEASSELAQAPIFIDDTPSRTMTEIAALARRLKRRQNLSLIIIDYLQLIEPDNYGDSRQEQVARIARRLKGMARELKVPVLCLSQLNRESDKTGDHKPRLSQLRESGAIEQDADVVMFVHREEYYASSSEDKEKLRGKAELIIAKQRNGPTGDVKMTWIQDYTRFVDAAREEYDFT